MHVKNSETPIWITLNGRKVRARHHESVLLAARRSGVHIPSLCHHDALETLGACRLCLVEIVRRGKHQVVAACTYPAEENLEVITDTAALGKHRAMVLELLLARAPGSAEIQALAAAHGVERPRFTPGDDTCILCGLCTRVCETYATAAITTVNRGDKKAIGTPADEPPEDCIACGACAEICPTGHITATQHGGQYQIWDKSIPLPVCVVDDQRCRGCGACEAACPFSIPRVILRRDRGSAAKIDAGVCRGCGVCRAACPSAAIRQPRAEHTGPITATASPEGRVLAIGCDRSALAKKRLPERVDLLPLPCTGGVSQAMLLGALARGYDGVLVLGRHQETCRLNGAEEQPRAEVDRVAQLAELIGLGPGRVAFREPPPGPRGPRSTVEAFLDGCTRSPLLQPIEPAHLIDSPDGAMAILTWLSGREELCPSGDYWLAAHGLAGAESGKPALAPAALPYLSILLSAWIDPDLLVAPIKDALAVLSALGIEAGVAVAGFRTGEARLTAQLPGTDFYSLCPGCSTRLKAAGGSVFSMIEVIADRGAGLPIPGSNGLVACADDDPDLPRIIETLGLKSHLVPAGPDVGLRLAISGDERTEIEQRLAGADAAGATALLLASPGQLFQHLLFVRSGAWRRTHVEPLLPTGLALGAIGERRADR